MTDPSVVLDAIAWPLGMLLAWAAGELAFQWLHLPRISVYATVGFLLAPAQSGFLPDTQFSAALVLANIAFGLILFECGYRINLRWMLHNPWLGASCLAESLLTFGAVYVAALWIGLDDATSLLLAALSMATSPAAVVRVVNEQRSSGQVTERVLLFAALNCIFAVLLFKVVAGFVMLRSSGSLWQAASVSIVVLAISTLLGGLFGIVVPALLRITRRAAPDATLAFALSIMLLVLLAHELKLSPVLATLTFGMVARHRRIVLGASQRGFGAIGDLLSILLFMFVAATLEWRQVLDGAAAAALLVVARQLAKLAGTGLFAHLAGMSWRKGTLLGVAMAPLSAFVILVLEQTRHLGIDFVDQLAPLGAAALFLEIVGPIATQWSLFAAREASAVKD